MFRGVIIYGAGVYTGVYIAQNYQIDKVDSPSALVQKVQNSLTQGSDGKKK